jgi:Mor family transcriptional regulator
MSREKTDRNNLIIEDIKKGDYLVDIAKKFNVSPSLIGKIKRRIKVGKNNKIKK